MRMTPSPPLPKNIAMMIETEQIRHVLVVKLRYHGDVLLTSPVFSVLKKRMPNAQIDALIYDETRPMLENHPAIANIITISRSWKKNKRLQIKKERELLKTLKARQYDLIIHLTEHWRMAWTTRLLKPKYSVAPFMDFKHNRWYHYFWKKSFSKLFYFHDYPRHMVETNLDALRVLGFKIEDEEKKLSFYIPQQAKERVENILNDLNISDYILLHPSSRMFYKCWSPQKWAVVLKCLQKNNYPIILNCAPDEKEREYIEKILSFLDNQNNIFILNGVLNLKEMGALIQQAKLFLGVDSAPMHMAAALETPQVVLFGSTGDLQWGAWCAPHLKRILTADAKKFPCRPCKAAGCGNSWVADCLEALSPLQVLSAIDDLLGEQQ